MIARIIAVAIWGMWVGIIVSSIGQTASASVLGGWDAVWIIAVLSSLMLIAYNAGRESNREWS